MAEPYTDADVELVRERLQRFPSKTTPETAARSVLDGLTAAGWRPPFRFSDPGGITVHLDPPPPRVIEMPVDPRTGRPL